MPAISRYLPARRLPLTGGGYDTIRLFQATRTAHIKQTKAHKHTTDRVREYTAKSREQADRQTNRQTDI